MDLVRLELDRTSSLHGGGYTTGELLDDTVLTAPRSGRVPYQLAPIGEVLPAGGRVVTMLDPTDVSMIAVLSSTEAGRIAYGAEARLALDAWPAYVIPASVSFVSPDTRFTPRQVEITQERQNLMFRVELRIPVDLLRAHAAYKPQGSGRNLYPTLGVTENAAYVGRSFGQHAGERGARSAELLRATGFAPFASRPAGQLSGGMKQKLSLCCALMHEPELLTLDEPTTGVDPLSRRQFWALIATSCARSSGMSVLVATADMEDAERFDRLAAMNVGQMPASGTPTDLVAAGGASSLEEAPVAMLPEALRPGHAPVVGTTRPLPKRARRSATSATCRRASRSTAR